MYFFMIFRKWVVRIGKKMKFFQGNRKKKVVIFAIYLYNKKE